MPAMYALTLLLLLAPWPQTGSLAFDAPAEWKSRPPASTMRVAEFVVPRAAGDAEDGELIVYFFGGGGGSVEANIQRWVGQFQQPNGKDVSSRATFNVGALRVTSIDVSGTYVAELRPGAAERHNKPDFRMRAAVVETPKGPYFIRFIGPANTVKQASSTFDQFMKSLRFK
jgi:hypothetical protein